jgi:GTP 3',8-cyclase
MIASQAPRLTDPHGRWIRKLRVSLTDVCNFRCLYCMPGNVRFQPASTLVPPDEIIRMCGGLVDAGIREIRLTGGEPLARKEFGEILDGVSKLPLEKLGLTSNGYWLEEWLPALADTPCQHLNISLDSLDPVRFKTITGNPHFDRVFRSILRAKEMGFNVKINVVVFRGANDDEAEGFADFSAKYQIPVRFLEFMKIGPQREQHAQLLVPAAELIEGLRQKMTLTPIQAETDATAFSFRTDAGGEVGFIASETRPFCGSCSRLRLNSRGMLRACLMSEAGVDIKGVPVERYPEILQQVMPMKPFGRLPELIQPMHEVGG